MKLRQSILIVVALLVTTVFALLMSPIAVRPQTAVAGNATPDSLNYLPLVLRSGLPTATPTATATATIPAPTVAPANVQITLIVYNPAGDDVQGEYVRIENKGGVTAVMTGWTLSDDDGRVFTFPSFTLAAGAPVQIWTRSGANTSSDLFWNQALSIWTNTGDVAYLRSSSGTLIDSCGYAGGGAQAGC